MRSFRGWHNRGPEAPLPITMVTFLKRLLIFLFLVFLAGWFLPGEFDAATQRVIEADRPLIHSYVTDLRSWPSWTAWRAEDDPECEWTYEGPALGEGHAYSWDGPELGKGRMEITSESLAEGITFDLWFDDSPDPVHGSITYADAEDGGVTVTWSIWGHMPGYLGGWFALLMDMFATPDFDKSLEGLDEACSGGLGGRLEDGVKEVLEGLGA